MTTLHMHERESGRMQRFNGPILDHSKLREGTYAALLTAAACVGLVLTTKLVYLIF